MEIGTSLFDQAGADIVGEIMEMAKAKGVEIVLPVDFVVSNKFGEDGEIKTATVSSTPPHPPLCTRVPTTLVQWTWDACAMDLEPMMSKPGNHRRCSMSECHWDHMSKLGHRQ